MLLASRPFSPVKPQHSTEHGNVLFLILIAVALFAVLSYAVTNSTRGSGDISQEKADLIASQLLQFGSSMEAAITRMRISNGCSEVEISTEHSGVYGTDFINPSAPASRKCHLFDPAGGGLYLMVLKIDDIAPLDFTNYMHFSTPKVRNAGIDTNPDLTFLYFFQSEAVCRAINEAAGIGRDTPLTSGWAFPAWQGAFLDNGYTPNTVDQTYWGHQTMCFEYPSDPSVHVFFYLVVAR
jgi:hypothetical protein